ncbi:MAG: short-chain dehydrogenase [Sphingopyxis sp.]|jgi:NAD(P)-dependent dehydrogenase (short-subunit alcohol dehydrogenase family)|nr:short-chain dehydrogenase [Sphingopyxis sp.]OGT54957.1 MAG: short-chain dehydrogenase [Gammaproteobacteria bacterium RIFCSPHIGHO2_12_FULL_63_22]
MTIASTPSFDLSGRVALVTGASSGFGAHWSRLLAAAGARVVMAARRVDRLAATVEEIAAHGGKAHAVALDVADEDQTRAAYDEAERVFGTVDTIIANAGIGTELSTFDIDVDSFDAVLATNLRGVFLTVREGARRLIAAGSAETGRGRVVIVSSVTARKAYAQTAAYGASKAAVLHMSRIMARDWARKGINVNTIIPGYFKTELTGDLFDTASGEYLLKSFPRRRLGELTDMDVPLLFFTSDHSARVTGSELMIDDGQTL